MIIKRGLHKEGGSIINKVFKITPEKKKAIKILIEDKLSDGPISPEKRKYLADFSNGSRLRKLIYATS